MGMDSESRGSEGKEGQKHGQQDGEGGTWRESAVVPTRTNSKRGWSTCVATKAGAVLPDPDTAVRSQSRGCELQKAK